VEIILKKLDLEDILKKEMNLFGQSSATNSSDISIDESSVSNVLIKLSDNLLTNKISETIQNIKTKKQYNFYKSQMVKNNVKKTKSISSKINKTCLSSSKQDSSEIEFGEDSNEEEIFVNSSTSSKTTNNFSANSSFQTASLTPPEPVLTNSSISYIPGTTEALHTPLRTHLEIRQSARSKLSAFKFNKKSTSPKSVQAESSNLESSQILDSSQGKSTLLKPPCALNIFCAEDEDDLSYLDID